MNLLGAYAASWQASEPMLAVTTRQITQAEYSQAVASCDSYLSNPLPRGVHQVITWEKEDIARLQKVEENFEAALGDADRRGDSTSFVLADGTNIKGSVRREKDGYYLHLAEGRKWRIRLVDLAPSGVLKLAGMVSDDPEAVLTSALYELYHGSAGKALVMVNELESKLEAEKVTRYRNKIQLVTTLLARSIARARASADPRDIQKAAELVEGARTLMKQNDWDRAYQLLDQAARLNPAESGTWSLLAECATAKRLYSEAAGYYRRALAFNPTNSLLWNNLGKLYLDQEELGLALAAFGQSTAINPADPVAAEGRIEALTKLGQEDAARRVKEAWEKARER
jgi:tetratricopeptide (TPR) repeat protein